MKSKKSTMGKRLYIYLGLGLALVIAAGIAFAQPFAKPSLAPSATSEAVSATGKTASLDKDGNLVIQKAAVGSDAVFVDYDAKGTAMQVIAVKASDGTFRTAFNTCQVCQGSPYAYFEQSGNKLVCQNCKNQFLMSQVEKERGGCNPAPITAEDKKETADTITISKEVLDGYAKYFANWKKF